MNLNTKKSKFTERLLTPEENFTYSGKAHLRTNDVLTPDKTTNSSDVSTSDMPKRSSGNDPYQDALRSVMTLSDYDLSKLLVDVEYAVARKDLAEIAWLQVEMQAKTLILLKSIDSKLYNLTQTLAL